MNTISEAIVEIVAEVAEIDPKEIETDDKGLKTTLAEMGIDSLMGLEIALHVERRFDVRFDDAELGGVRALGDLIEMTKTKIALAELQ